MQKGMIPYSTQSIDKDDIDSVLAVLENAALTCGDKIEEFTEALAKYCNCKYAILFNSATSALLAGYMATLSDFVDTNAINPKTINKFHKILLGKDLRLNDEEIENLFQVEVITTPISFAATSNMLLPLYIKPVFAEVLSNGNINPSKIESLITPKTKAIISVDYAGNPVDYAAIKSICKKHNLLFISDASHSLGASYDGRKIGDGKLADFSVFSFHPVKPITTAEGGVLVSDNEKIIDKARLISSHGVNKIKPYYYDISSLGFNFRMNELSAALGVSQLKKLDNFISKRQENLAVLKNGLRDCKNLFFPTFTPDSTSSLHLSTINLAPSLWCEKEAIIQEFLKNKIGVQVHYRPIYQFTLYKRLFPNSSLISSSEDFYHSTLSLPNHQRLSGTQLQYIIEVTKKIIG